MPKTILKRNGELIYTDLIEPDPDKVATIVADLLWQSILAELEHIPDYRVTEGQHEHHPTYLQRRLAQQNNPIAIMGD